MFAILIAAPLVWGAPSGAVAAPWGTVAPYPKPVPWVPRSLPPSHPSVMIPLPDAKR